MKGIDPSIRKAGHFARRAHLGQQRKYRRSPCSPHPFRVARAVAGHDIGSRIMVAAALLHDTVEDTQVSAGRLGREFGPEIAALVAELTKPALPEAVSRNAEVIKLFDRLDNLNKPSAVDDDFAVRYLAESKVLAAVLGETNLSRRK